MITIDNITVKIKAIVTDASDIAIAFLFGSAVNNRLRFDSDIDIAIAGYKVFSLNRMEEIACQLSKSINRPIDLIDLLSTKGLVFHRALTTVSLTPFRQSCVKGVAQRLKPWRTVVSIATIFLLS